MTRRLSCLIDPQLPTSLPTLRHHGPGSPSTIAKSNVPVSHARKSPQPHNTTRLVPRRRSASLTLFLRPTRHWPRPGAASPCSAAGRRNTRMRQASTTRPRMRSGYKSRARKRAWRLSVRRRSRQSTSTNRTMLRILWRKVCWNRPFPDRGLG
jgi:hypothetical protein